MTAPVLRHRQATKLFTTGLQPPVAEQRVATGKARSPRMARAKSGPSYMDYLADLTFVKASCPSMTFKGVISCNSCSREEMGSFTNKTGAMNLGLAPTTSVLWNLTMACTSSVLFVVEGLNCVTASSIFVVTGIGLTASSKMHRRKSARYNVCMVLLQFSILFGALVSKRCAKIAGIELDVKAVKFLFVPSSETKAAFGDNFAEATFSMLFETLAPATILAILNFCVATLLARKAKTMGQALTTLLKATCAIAVARVLGDTTFYIVGERAGCRDAIFSPPPPTLMKTKPSMIFIVIDSLRKDMFGNDTFPKTLQETVIDDSTNRSCTQWHRHDSGGFQSDQGYSTLYYSMRAPTYRHYYQYKQSKDVRRWPLSTLKDQGYYLHRIAAANFKYCWVLLEECELMFRDWDTSDPSWDELTTGGDTRVFDNAKQWIEDWMKTNASAPFFLSLDLQDIRFPYAVKQDVANDKHYHEPFMTQSEVYSLKQNVPKMDMASLDALRPKFINRVKNSMLGLDILLADFLHSIRSHVKSDTIIVLTSDHGELYMDGVNKNHLGHALEDPSDLQRRVPLTMCGPSNIITDLQVPDDTVTSHTDVFPSLLEACGATLSEEWKHELDFRSYYRHQSTPEDDDGGLVHAQHPWSDLNIIISGNKRVVTKGPTIVNFVSPAGSTNADDARELTDLIKSEKERHWAGLQSTCDDIGTKKGEDLEEGNSDLAIAEGDPAFMRNWLRSTHAMNQDLVTAIEVTVDPWVTIERVPGPTQSRFTIDVLSIGSLTRPEYLHAQKQTWGAHRSVREFWGYTEYNDFNQTCGKMSRAEVDTHVTKCHEYKGWGKSMRHYIGDGYTLAEGVIRRDAGWLCAQRRVGRSLAWIQKMFTERSNDLPDYLLLVDDDTYVDLVSFEEYIVRNSLDPSKPQMHGACLFHRSGYIKWSFPYGGFGTFFTRGSIERMMRPIRCKNADPGDAFLQGVCSSLQKNRIGERALFHEGMSVVDLFHSYSALRTFCIHSDWLTGYIANFYMLSERDEVVNDDDPRMNMFGMAVWPEQCGNITMQCVESSDFCHRQPPKAMHYFSMYSHAKNPDHYRQPPTLSGKALSIS